jgi:hypothetical protein
MSSLGLKGVGSLRMLVVSLILNLEGFPNRQLWKITTGSMYRCKSRFHRAENDRALTAENHSMVGLVGIIEMLRKEGTLRPRLIEEQILDSLNQPGTLGICCFCSP